MGVLLIIIGLIGAFIVSARMYRKNDKDKEGSSDFTDYWDEKINRIGGDPKGE